MAKSGGSREKVVEWVSKYGREPFRLTEIAEQTGIKYNTVVTAIGDLKCVGRARRSTSEKKLYWDPRSDWDLCINARCMGLPDRRGWCGWYREVIKSFED